MWMKKAIVAPSTITIEKAVVVPDMVKSTIMPAVTMIIPMPRGAAEPAQTTSQAASQAPPRATPQAAEAE